MSAYVLLRADEATLLAESPLLPAADAALVGDLRGLLDALAEERTALAQACDAAREAAWAAGHAEGRATGEAAARDGAAAALADALRPLRAERTAVQAQAADLALRIAERLLPEIAGERMLPGLLASALDEMDDAPHTLLAHPDDLAQLSTALEGTGVTGLPDERMPRGTLRLQSETGSADVGLDARLDALAEAMRG